MSPSETAGRLAEGLAAQRDGDLEAAVAAYAELEARSPETLEAPLLRAFVEIEQGELQAALPRLRRVLARRPGWYEARSTLAYLHEQLGQWREAAEVYQAVLDEGGRPGVALQLAHVLEVMGKLPQAMALLRETADRPGLRTGALSSLAQIAPEAIGDDDLAWMLERGRGEDAPIGLLFALGEALERRGRHAEAFDAFAEGNRRNRAALIAQEPSEQRDMTAPEAAVRRLSPEAAEREAAAAADRAISVFSRSFLRANEGHGSSIAAPIFIVGMPRSGSTLIEQILSSHRRVQGMGESPALGRVIAGQFPMNLLAAAGPDHYRRLAEAYLASMHARGWKSSPRFVDKMLGNHLHVGMIHLMFPRAVILHAARDPVDTCLANFRKLFATGNELSYDLADIGRDYVRYREVMAHWDEVLPGRVVEVRHEALVADPDAAIRRLVTESCGLDWDDACLRFHQTRRPVRTASVAQVRKPIFKTSVARWKAYEDRLGPLFEALGRYAPKRGD